MRHKSKSTTRANEDYRLETGLFPVVWLSSLVREVAVINSAGIEPLELPVLVVSVLVLHVVLRPIDVSSFGGESRGEKNEKMFPPSSCSSPADVERDEGDTNSHDDEERLKGNVVTDRLESQSLHEAHVVVFLQQF